jgi:MHS family proline/betaine transporter-like MFS transporter
MMETQMDYSATPRRASANGLDALDAPRLADEPQKRVGHAKAIAAITLGNGLEFFDFTIYSFFATIIGKLYFPVEGQLVQLMLSVGTFGVGFIMRPVGGRSARPACRSCTASACRFSAASRSSSRPG